MRAFGLWCSLLVTSDILSPATLSAQEPFTLLRDLPTMQVVIDGVHASITQPEAEPLRKRVLQRLRAAGVPVTDTQDPVTLGSFIFAPLYPFDKPTFLVSLNMAPDGCAFVANFYVRMPVGLAGHTEKMTVSVYASRSYIYSTTWSDHSPVLDYIDDDFIGAWRSANRR